MQKVIYHFNNDRRAAVHTLKGLVRLKCVWYESGDVDLRTVSEGRESSLDAALTQFLFGAKPGLRSGYETAERLLALAVTAEPVHEGLDCCPPEEPEQ